MTRINVGIPPCKLADRHLLAEHREIKRIPNVIKKGKAKLSGIPDHFTLGTGHVKFFYNKLNYLHLRYIDLRDECIARGFDITDYEDAFRGLPKELYGNWQPAEHDVNLIKERIAERLVAMKRSIPTL